jgi:hypothetical protein
MLDVACPKSSSKENSTNISTIKRREKMKTFMEYMQAK